jgi:hypothetical protein
MKNVGQLEYFMNISYILKSLGIFGGLWTYIFFTALVCCTYKNLTTLVPPNLVVRVARLGEFSPNGWLFIFGSFFLNCRSSPHFGPFFPRWRLCISFDKKSFFSPFLAKFFTNSPGHPAAGVYFGVGNAGFVCSVTFEPLSNRIKM